MMWLLCCICVLGWLAGYCSTVPMQTVGMADHDIMRIVRSALSSAFHERDEQDRLDLISLRSGEFQLQCNFLLKLSHIQQICRIRLWKYTRKELESPFKWKCINWIEWNIVTKGEIARFEQFLLLSPCFQKAVCCRGVIKRLYGGKG